LSDEARAGRVVSPVAAHLGVGAELREARERRGRSLDQISRTTKISLTILRIIETNQLEKLPPPVFLRGFLSAFAREVGLDPDDTVRRYLRQVQPEAETAEVAGHATSQATKREPTRGADRTASGLDADRRSVRAQWVTIAVLIVVAGYAAVRWRAHPADGTEGAAGPSEIAQPSSSPVPSSPPPAPAGVAAAGTPDATVAAVDGVALRIDLQPHGLCWISATVDGTRIVYRLMQPGEQQSIEVHGEAVLRIGDPAAFAFSINGTRGLPLGPSSAPVTVHITKQNFRNFLGS
jgi:cytoskeletal protein RodZ